MRRPRSSEPAARRLKSTPDALSGLLENEERANEALRKSEKDLQHTALHDSLTNLPNRKHFGDKLRRLISSIKDDATASFHVLFLDISKFKNINDSLGHTLGDKVLIIAAKRFVARWSNADGSRRTHRRRRVRHAAKGVPDVGKAQKVARRIYDNIVQPFSLSGNNMSINVNVGIAPCDAEYNSPEEILRDADIAMHFAKEWNSGVAVFTKELRDRFLERIRFETDLAARHRARRAVDALPAADRHPGRHTPRIRSASPLAPFGIRQHPAEQVYTHRRRFGPDHPDHRLDT